MSQQEKVQGTLYIQGLQENNMHFPQFTQSTVSRNVGTLQQKCNIGGIYESVIVKDLTFPLNHQKR